MPPKKVVKKCKPNDGKVHAYCLPCKGKVTLDEKVKLIKRKLPNGNTVSILCGFCAGCKTKNCTIVANSKK